MRDSINLRLAIWSRLARSLQPPRRKEGKDKGPRGVRGCIRERGVHAAARKNRSMSAGPRSRSIITPPMPRAVQSAALSRSLVINRACATVYRHTRAHAHAGGGLLRRGFQSGWMRPRRLYPPAAAQLLAVRCLRAARPSRVSTKGWAGRARQRCYLGRRPWCRRWSGGSSRSAAGLCTGTWRSSSSGGRQLLLHTMH